MKKGGKKYEIKRRTSCVRIIFKYMDRSKFLFSYTRVFYTSFAISTWRLDRAYANSIIVPLLSCFYFISYSFVLFFISLFCVDTRSFSTFVAFDLPDGQKVAQKIKLRPRQRSRTISGWTSPYDERRVPFHHVAVQSVQNRLISRANENNTHRFV